MDRLMLKRLEWTVRMAWMRHGAMGGMAVLSLLVAVALLLDVANDFRRLVLLESEISAKTTVSLARRPSAEPRNALTEAPAFPTAPQRSGINGKILAILDRLDTGPEQVRFKFETSAEAGLVRQVAVFNIKATWPEIAALLHKLQTVDRSVFISRLKITREGIEENIVDAEVQLGVITAASSDDGGLP